MVRKAVALLAGALLAAGLVVAGITAYKIIDPQAPARERALQQQLSTQWKAPAPVPGSPGATPTSAHITLITCTPVTLLFTPWRVIVTGVLAATQPR